MYFKMAKRLLFETDKRLLWKLIWNMGFKGMLSVQKFKRRLNKGEVFPPFLYISIINSCNLRCQGCWVDVAAQQEGQEDGQRLLRNLRRRAVHAPAAPRHPRRSSGLLLPGLHQRALHHP